MAKLQNIKAINQMLRGEHRTQTRKTIGFSDSETTAERNKKREIGEIWEEKDAHGNIIYWEQKNGYKTKSSVHPDVKKELDKVNAYLSSFPNCQKEVCTCMNPTSLDKKFRRLMGMCEDCLVSMETKLKIQGKFNQYALDKMKSNAQSFFEQADKEVEIIKESLKNVSFVNSVEGDVEKWTTDNQEALIGRIDEDYNKFKEKTLEKFEMGE